ncbi:MAG: sulfite exporter TauE/SafE family protein [Candidatus Coatesbacteria bacterium]|nr:sulfite exporter TauE/SafE family protein [Candidatus Coatesbacteria bacterium]
MNIWISASPAMAFGGLFIWGILSVIFSPCHLASLPLIIGFVGSSMSESRETPFAFKLSLTFCIGIFLTIFSLGLITSSIGRIAGDVGSLIPIIIGTILMILGIYLLDILPFNLPTWNTNLTSRKGYIGALFFGLSYGVVSGPCTFAFVAPVLALITIQKEILYGLFLMLGFTLGHILPLLVAGTSTGLVESWLNQKHYMKAANAFRKVSGVLIIIAGIYFIYSNLVK